MRGAESDFVGLRHPAQSCIGATAETVAFKHTWPFSDSGIEARRQGHACPALAGAPCE
ncbi:MAG TPA: hypothetical protein VLG28_12160 [Acidimicrobiia bacterium]|nr:hypothetical protein [Acidimicrobiia bacterium]